MKWLLFLTFQIAFAEFIDYQFIDDPIDVVIPCAKKDLITLDLCIEGIKKNVANLGQIIVVSKERYTEKADWFDEDLYPFTKFDLGLAIFDKDEEKAEEFANICIRSGWIYQQFLKLYASFVIPEISSNILVVDADVIFFRPVEFLTKDHAGLYNHGQEYYKPYFRQMKRLLPTLDRVFPEYSGIAHHMLFQKSVLEDLFSQIENYHNIETWKAICKTLDHNEIYAMSLSEYEIYFNFVFSRTNQVKLRPLKWANKYDPCEKSRQEHFKKGYDYIAYHEYGMN